jgi:hypothetical protein
MTVVLRLCVLWVFVVVVVVTAVTGAEGGAATSLSGWWGRKRNKERTTKTTTTTTTTTSTTTTRSFALWPNNHEDTTTQQQQQRVLLPQLPPHGDTEYLLEFVADSSQQCKLMEPLVHRLEEDLGTTVRRIDIHARPDYMTLFDAVGGQEGGNVPFFYNRRTARAICGATPYDNLQAWGAGGPFYAFVEQLRGSHRNEMESGRGVRSVGIQDHFQEVWNRVVHGVERKGRGKKKKNKTNNTNKAETKDTGSRSQQRQS